MQRGMHVLMDRVADNDPGGRPTRTMLLAITPDQMAINASIPLYAMVAPTSQTAIFIHTRLVSACRLLCCSFVNLYLPSRHFEYNSS
jgi:hypothetical protein